MNNKFEIQERRIRYITLIIAFKGKRRNREGQKEVKGKFCFNIEKVICSKSVYQNTEKIDQKVKDESFDFIMVSLSEEIYKKTNFAALQFDVLIYWYFMVICCIFYLPIGSR